MDVPRKRGGKQRTKAVDSKEPAASASVAPITDAPSFVMRKSAPSAKILAAMDAESEGLIADRDDGTDLFETSTAPIAEPFFAESDDDTAAAVVEETTGKVWTIPDTVGTLRRMPNAIETTQQRAPDLFPDAPAMASEKRVVAIRRHKSTETIAAVPVPHVETNLAQEMLAKDGPTYMRPRRANDLDRDDFDLQQPRETRDALTLRLGCRWFIDGARLEWCREGPHNLNPPGEPDSRHRHHFTRWYEMDRILVDIFARDSDAVRREIAEKIAAIRARAKVEGAPIGYLPAVKGAYIADDVIDAVKRGEIVPFQLAQMRTGIVA